MSHTFLHSREVLDFAEIMGPSRGEVGLWRAVICQAFLDATCSPRNRFQRHDKEMALAWFRGRSSDFYQVCECAGFEPDYVRERFARVLACKESFDHTLSGRRRAGRSSVLSLARFRRRRGRGGGPAMRAEVPLVCVA
ncbi:MAG: hypothetical protein J0L97_08355 [Alphaproteobacteria bacterium]|nr:hypothetical protein [Alphaproteobacteria bacterium]